MTTPALRGTRIGTARIRAPRADAASCAARCASIVPSLDLEPAAMPPQAILCIRSLPDPLPGGIDIRTRHEQMRPAAWEAAMRASVREALQRAARPIDGPVPPTADAVLFADPSEMLACAARDLCAGSLGALWWWRHLLPAAGQEAVLRGWHDAPAYLPAAFEFLMATGSAMAFVRRLSPRGAAQLLDAVLRTHGAAPLADAVAALWIDAPSIPAPGTSRVAGAAHLRRPAARVPEAGRLDPRSGQEAPSATTGAPAPWRHVVPLEWQRADLTPEQRTFASMCIVLRRAPALVRRPAFAVEFIAHLTIQSPPPSPAIPRAAGASAVVPHAPQAAAPPAGHPGSTTRGAPSSDSDAQRSSRATREDRTTLAAPRRMPASAPRDSSVDVERSDVTVSPPAPQLTTESAETGAARTVPVVADDALNEAADANRVPEPGAPAVDLEAGIESAYAGAFFLLNVARDLDLYAGGWDAGADLDLRVWDFIELIARHVLTPEEFDEDPLGAVLRSLSDPDAPPSSLTEEERAALVPRVCGHIEVSLGVEEASSLLVRRPGRVVRTAAHLDVHYSLDRHPIEIRMARLDRNPGWIPAAGVHVGFHFN